MDIQTSHRDVLDAVEKLPPEATLAIPEFGWDAYERLLEALGDDNHHLRVCYDSGRLEVLSLSSRHEQCARLVDLIVFVFCDVFGLPMASFGQTTWKKKSHAKGLEADACYYINSEKLIRGKEVIDLECDPSPDIAVEVDLTHSSLRKLSIYAALSIPEVWLYDGEGFQLYSLLGSEYVRISESRFLPGLTASMLNEVLADAGAGETVGVLQAFRKRLQGMKPQ